MRRVHQVLAAAFIMSNSIVSLAYASNCNVDGNVIASSLEDPVDTTTDLGGDVCGHTIYLNTTGTCYFRISDNDTITSGNCLTIGKGVQVDGGGDTKTLTCGDESCGNAIAYTSSGSGNTDIDNIRIRGCFSKGADGGTGFRNFTNSDVDVSHVSPPSTCTGTGGDFGVVGWTLVEKSIIGGATEWAVAPADGTLRDSVVRDSNIGVNCSSGGLIDNVDFSNNTYNLTGTGATIQSSVLHVPGTCDCWGAVFGCYASIENCATCAGDTTYRESDETFCD